MAKRYENMDDAAELDVPEKKKKVSLNPFDLFYGKGGKGVKKGFELNVMKNPGIKNFFKLLRFRLSQIFAVNLYLIFGNFPLLFILVALGYTTTQATSPNNVMYSAIEAVTRFDPSPINTALLDIFGQPASVAHYTTATIVCLAIAGLVLFTWGPVNVGTTYMLRNLMRGEPVFIWQDFWYAIKRNFRQAIIFGIIDVLMIAMLVYDIMVYRLNVATSDIGLFMFIISCGMAIIYFFARMYIYPMMITFDLSIFKLIKNGLFFSILGIKRNIMALFGVLAIVIIDFWLLQLVMPLGIILPFFIFFGLVWYICIYAAYPKIKEIMIDPYYNEVEVVVEEDAIMTDDVE